MSFMSKLIGLFSNKRKKTDSIIGSVAIDKTKSTVELPSILKKKKVKKSRTLSSQLPKDKRQYNPLVNKSK